jgi:hypothetical protein
MTDSRMALLTLVALAFVCCCPTITHAGAVRLTSASQLDPSDATVTYPLTGVVVTSPGGLDPAVGVPNPLVLSAGGNTLTFSKPTGLFVTNSFFGPDTLYTGNAYQQESGPITIDFATGVTEVGFLAFPNFTGPPDFGFTLTAFNGATVLGTFSFDTFGTSGGIFLGVQATGGDVITRIVVNHTIPDFAIGPVTFGAPQAVPEPATLLLLSTGLGGVGAMVRRRRRG